MTVRALESLIRLSEALARAHCDDTIRPNYVREVCRLLRNSNINIAKNDIEFEQLQEQINVDLAERRQNEQELFEAQNQQAEAQPDPTEVKQKKVKISFDEYQKLSYLIVSCMKEFEANNQENVQ